MFLGLKTKFYYKIPSKPFSISIEKIETLFDQLQTSNNEEDSEEYSEEEEETNNTDKSFKSDECVTCLTNPPNILFCNCGHIPICVECDKVKSLNTCPVCKFENKIKRTIIY